ncbi:MAG: response regulator [Polyangiales bacterium]
MDKKRVLIVEDDQEIRDTLCEILSEEGYGVAGVENGMVALDWLRHQPNPGVILLDLMMPIMNGWQFRAEQMRDPALAKIPVVIISATGSASQNVVPLDDPAAFIRKPIDLQKLLETVERCCGMIPLHA